MIGNLLFKKLVIKIGRVFAVTIAILIQVLLGVLYGFSAISVPAWGCFTIWCLCAAIIYKFSGAAGIV